MSEAAPASTRTRARTRAPLQPSTLEQIAIVGRRSLIRTLRQPAAVIPAFVFPAVFLALNSGGLSRASDMPGFPADSYFAFYLSTPFVQGALFATINAGTDLAKDIQTKFLSRLTLTPISSGALLIGQLAGVLVISVISSLVFIAVGLIAGVDYASGPLGVLVLLVLATLIAFAVASIGVMMGVRTGTAEAVQGMFPVFFIFLFLSSLAMPRPLIEQDWFRFIADWNPASYLIEAIRSLVITGWDWQALGLGFGIAIVIGGFAVVGANRALRKRLSV